MALAPTPRSAATISCWRQSSGNGAAIMPARSTPSSAITLSTVLASCKATMASLRRPSPRRRAAKRRDRPVGFGVGELARRAPVQALPVRRIDQRERVGGAHAGAAEQVVERGAACGLAGVA